MRFFPSDLHRQQFDHLQKSRRLTLSGTGNLNAKAYLLSELVRNLDDKLSTLFWVIEDAKEGDKTCEDFRFWSQVPVHNFTLPEGRQLTDLEKMLRLYTVLRPERKVVVIDPQTFFAAYPSRQDIEKSTLRLRVGDTLDSVAVINQLLEIGYEFSPDDFLPPGSYCKQGGLLNIYIPTLSSPVKVELDGAQISGLYEYDQETQQLARKHESIDVVPLKFARENAHVLDFLGARDLVVNDEIDLSPEFAQKMDEFFHEEPGNEVPYLVSFTAFPEESDQHYFYLYYLSILKFQDVYDFLNDLQEKWKAKWKVMIFTRHFEELKALLREEKIPFSSPEDFNDKVFLHIEDAHRFVHPPQSFQNPQYKVAVLGDREIFDFRQIRRKTSKIQRKINLEFLRSLKDGDYVVHVDHGIGKFVGIVQQLFEG
ncbi:MAG: hypothetical protein Q8P95_04020, partial [bacterium]|nr:hypothetical protein [bacterium]